MSVPGRYLSGFPVSPKELVTFLSGISKPVKLLCGPAAKFGFGMSGGKQVTKTDVVKNVFDIIANGDGEIVISELLKNHLNAEKINPALCRKNPHAIKNFAIKGAAIVTQQSSHVIQMNPDESQKVSYTIIPAMSQHSASKALTLSS